MAKVDATVEKQLASQYGVQGFPTLVWFPSGQKSGNHETYQGARDASAMKEFAIKQVGEIKIKHLSGQAVWDSACKDQHVCAVVFLPSVQDVGAETRVQQIEAVQAVANEFTNAKVIWAEAGQQPALQDHLEANDFPAVFVLANLKGRYAKLLKGLTQQNFKDLMQDIFGGKHKQWRKLGPAPKMVSAQQSCSDKEECASL